MHTLVAQGVAVGPEAIPDDGLDAPIVHEDAAAVAFHGEVAVQGPPVGEVAEVHIPAVVREWQGAQARRKRRSRPSLPVLTAAEKAAARKVRTVSGWGPLGKDGIFDAMRRA